jgi:dUTP pyrophosphatase
MKIKIIKYNDNIKLPFRAHHNDAGADCFAPDNVTINPNETVCIGLGFGVCLPDGFALFPYGRSSLAKAGLVHHLPPIDSGYTGEIHVLITNTTNERYEIKKDDKICQLLLLPIITPEFVENLGDERGNGGFGSTGK